MKKKFKITINTEAYSGNKFKIVFVRKKILNLSNISTTGVMTVPNMKMEMEMKMK